jgi:hypothetical protein
VGGSSSAEPPPLTPIIFLTAGKIVGTPAIATAPKKYLKHSCPACQTWKLFRHKLPTTLFVFVLTYSSRRLFLPLSPSLSPSLSLSLSLTCLASRGNRSSNDALRESTLATLAAMQSEFADAVARTEAEARAAVAGLEAGGTVQVECAVGPIAHL